MSTNVVLNGVTYAVPAEGDSGWGTVLSNFFIAIGAGVLQKSGGSFALTAETDFGASFGLKVPYIKSQSANSASAGVVRLGNAESIKWRNAANSGDLDLTVNASNALQFNGASFITSGTGLIVNADINAAAAIAYSKLNLASSIVNGDVSASAAIVYSKLSLTGGIVNADVSASAAIAYSKLSLATSLVNADISASAAIAYSKLNLSASILNADISASAAIAMSKLAVLTVSRVLQSNASTGAIEVSAVTNTELGYLSGVTSAIQTQLGSLVLKSLYVAKGDIVAASAASAPATVTVGTNGTFLKADSSASAGVSWASVAGSALALVSKTTTYTATTSDDVILVTTGSAWTLGLYTAIGNSGKIIRIKKTSSDLNLLTIDANGSETIDGALTTSIAVQYEQITLISDGAGWNILVRTYPTEWIAYAPTFTGLGTATSVNFFSRRIGDTLQVKGTFSSGTATATVAAITIGYNGTSANVSLDTAKVSSSGSNVGTYALTTTGALAGYIFTDNTAPTLVRLGLAAAGAAGFSYVTGSTGVGNTTFMSTFFEVPIAGWK